MDSDRIVVTNNDFKKVQSVPLQNESGFVLYHGSRTRTWKDLFQVVHRKSSQCSKDLTCFHKSYESSQIFTNP
jgi:hypothetical protein